jgi:hypothetical protein
MRPFINFFIFLFFVFSFACNKDNEKQNVKNTVQDTLSNKTKTENNSNIKKTDDKYYLDSTFYVLVNKGVSPFKFEIWRVKGSFGVKHFDDIYKINIYDSSSGKLLQTIDSSAMADVLTQLEFDDYNFDGYLDIYIKDRCAILDNCRGIVFIYGTNTHLFNIAHEFDEMTTVRADQKKKMIYSLNRSAAGASFVYEKFKYTDGKLILIESETQEVPETSQGKYHYVLKRRDNSGSMQTISDKYLKEPRMVNYNDEQK